MASIKICGSCGEKFECNAEDILNCYCYAVQLSPEAADRIKRKYEDCLCGKCLAEAGEEVNEVKVNSVIK